MRRYEPNQDRLVRNGLVLETVTRLFDTLALWGSDLAINLRIAVYSPLDYLRRPASLN